MYFKRCKVSFIRPEPEIKLLCLIHVIGCFCVLLTGNQN